MAVLFHESEILGAGISVVRVLDELASIGWTSSGWFPAPGPLVARAATSLVSHDVEEKPIAVSVSGWLRAPGLPARLRATAPYLRAVARWLRADRPDVVHANSLLMLPEATVARRLGIPVVLQVHELPPPGRKREASLRWAASVADVLVGVSGAVTGMLERQARTIPVLTVRNGVPDLPPAQPDATSFVVGTIGHVARTKGTDIFLRAAQRVVEARPAIRFEHVGPARIWPDAAFDDEVERLAQAIPDAARMLGRSPAASSALRGWKVFVLPSRQEAFPLSTLEAMASGLAVVAASVGGIPEQIEHLETGVLVPAEDVEELSRWIIRLHDDEPLRARLGRSAREHVRRNFTIEAQAHGLAAAYAAARARRRAGGPLR